MPSTARSTPFRRILLAWLAPDLALTFAFLTVLSLFFLFGGATGLFSDTDTGWHIRNGERILFTGALPQVDPYSFSKPGQPWIAWEWGADIMMGAVNRAAGLAGIALLYGIAIAASVWMWFRLNQAAGGNFLIASLLFIPMASTTGLHWLARPHVFSWLFLLGAVWFCERMPRQLEWRHFAGVLLATIVWANLHGSFFLGPVIALIYAAGAYLKPLIWDEPESSQSTTLALCRNYTWLALTALLATFANPNGWQLHRHLIAYLFNSSLLDQISEFRSFDFHQDGALRVMLALTICFAGAFASLVVRKPERFLLSILLTWIALRSIRALPVAALLLLPLANGSITAVLAKAKGLSPWLRRRLDAALDYGDRLQVLERPFHGLALAPIAAILIFVAIRTSAGFPVLSTPVAASGMIATLPVDARILSSDAFGGYLIYRFHGERKVFFDGRSDFYGKDFLDRYSRMMEVRPGWRAEFNRWKFTHALLPPDCSLIPALEADGWRELYRDATAVLLAGSLPGSSAP